MSYRPKPWYQSRTIWLNTAAAFGAAIAKAAGAPAWAVELGLALQAAANVLLRLDTTQPIRK